MCPTVRRTERLSHAMNSRVDRAARALVEGVSPAVLARAVNFLYTEETLSSFALEGETPSASRSQRFVAALRAAPAFDPADKAALTDLQGMIVDPRYRADGWRDVQNFVGTTRAGFRDRVDFVCPRPADVAGLMEAWMTLTRRVVDSDVDPVVAAAVAAFAFVLIHPFEDGNGRIHRFLVHHVLAKRKFSPPGVIFPVSAAILRDRQGYSAVLESFSQAILPFVRWYMTPERAVVVENDTADLYRYYDATAFAEFLYDKVGETVSKDLEEEIGFIDVFDRAFESAREIVDMPDRKASLFVRICMQNGGTLGRSKRSKFSELDDAEVAAMETAVRNAMKR